MARQEESRSKARAIMAVRQVRLGVVKGGEAGRVYLTGGDSIRVGKALDNDVVLADDTVSRRHLRIQIRPKGYFVEDLGSTNGTVLDGSAVEKAYGKPGSIIAAGDVVLSLRSVYVEPELHAEDIVVPAGFVAEDAVSRSGIAAVDLAAGIASPVTIVGEPGTGRRTMAKLLAKRAGPGGAGFVEIDVMRPEPEVIAAVEAGLVEGGQTLVLVEPWGLSVSTQLRLLRLLDDHWEGRGEEKWTRIVAVSSHELMEDALRGVVDRRLAEYLTRIVIRLAPLRKRPKDARELARRFLAHKRGDKGTRREQEASKATGETNAPGADPKHSELAPWLEVVVRHLRLSRNILDLQDVVQGLSLAGLLDEDSWANYVPGKLELGTTFSQWKQSWLEEAQRRYLRWILAEAGGNLSKAARMADMDRKHLGRLVTRHGLRESRRRVYGKLGKENEMVVAEKKTP
ncbi:MAG: FHA domain-containing protein [Deltaproteobacteria bacterium]|nr:FHA domain-containing protein [Deltaproteobacteria bacterium]